MRFLPLALLAVTLPALATTYRWVDKQGQVHFSQMPPQSGEPYSIVGPAPPATDAPNQKALNDALKKANDDAPKQREVAAQAAQERAARQERCKAAMNNLAYMDAQTARRMSTTDKQGNVSRMTDEEFQSARAQEEQRIRENCD